ncbi:MAG: hypothetical protein KDD69_14790 [Bdellovibrionales bacterium]|nr:hypothetical protein [Bdellovibrionales bacterium]
MRVFRQAIPSLSVRRLSFRVAGVCFLVIAGLVAGCSKKEEKAQTSQSVVGATASGVAQVELASELLKRVPGNAAGFFVWNGSHEAYGRLLESPWAGSTSLGSMLEGSNERVERVKKFLSAAGLDPDDKQTWRKLFSEAVFFVTPPEGGSAEPVVGAVFRSDGIDLAEKMAAIRKELAASGEKVADVAIDGGTGFNIVVPQEADPASAPVPPQEQQLTVLVRDGVAALASQEGVARNVLTAEPKNLPTLVETDDFKRAVAQFPAQGARFASGYLDVSKVLGASGQLPGAPLETLPLRAVSIALSMTDAPQTDVRMLYREQNGEKSWIEQLVPSSSQELVSAVPTKPLLFFSVDGQALSKLKEMASAQIAAQPDLASQLAFIDGVKRLGISARLAPLGQSALPIPDLLLLLETDKPQEAQAQLKALIAGNMKNAPMMAGNPWTEKELPDGTKVQSMITPLGFGAFLASAEGLLLAASTESQLRSALAERGKPQFVGELSKPVSSVLADQSTVGNLYINFEQVGAFLENMGGVLAMFAPQDRAAQDWLLPENIASVKKMGLLVGSVTVEGDAIDIRSFYQVPS